MKFNPQALSIRAPELLEGLSWKDFPAALLGVLEAGWTIDDDAVLLRSFRDSYYGERKKFGNITGYEIAVNGRAIPDLDLDPKDLSTVRTLLRRGVAFAWQTLYLAGRYNLGVDLNSYILVVPTLFDASQVTGNVTFCAARGPGISYLNTETYSEGILVSLDSTECDKPLEG